MKITLFGGTMDNKKLERRIAKLESVNDQLVAELRYLDEIAVKLGFCQGLKTLKEAAVELIEMEEEMGDFSPDGDC